MDLLCGTGALSNCPTNLFPPQATVWGLSPDPQASSNFETSFFGLLSIVYGLFASQTFLFLYEVVVQIRRFHHYIFCMHKTQAIQKNEGRI